MKVIIDTEDSAALDALAEAIVKRLKPLLQAAPVAEAPAPAAAPAKAPTKPAKPAAAPKAADAPKADAKPAEGAPARDAVHKALRDAAGPKEAADYAAKRDAALAVLHKFAPSLAELAVDQYQTVIDAIKAPLATGDEDPF